MTIRDKNVTRRKFIKTSTVIGASSLVGSSALIDLVQAAGTTETPEQTSQSTTLADLAAVKGQSYFENTIRAVEAIGGMGKFVLKDSKVGLLANVVWEHPGTNVRPEVMLAVIKMCRDAGAKEVRSLTDFGKGYWERNELAAKHQKDVDAVVIGGGDYKMVEIPEGKYLKEASVKQGLFECDVLINVTVSKNHNGCNFTGSLKNMMGACAHDPTNRFIHFGNKTGEGNWYSDVEWLNQCIADLSYLRIPDLCVTDGTEFLTTNGPFGPGKIGKKHTVVACADPVAIDAYSVRFLELKPEDCTMIKHAFDRGFGQMDLSKLKVSEITA